MKPRELLGSGHAPDGSLLTLHREAAGFVVRIGNEVLMSSRRHGSEQAMAAPSLEAALRSPKPRVLVGGLGMGFTLRAVLDVLPRHAEVVVAELFDCVADWNRGPLAELSSRALDDPRVRLETVDVQELLRRPGSGFDAILLDVDNGPDALVTMGNRQIYEARGLAALRAALRPGGTLAVWSAEPSKRFERELARAGFQPERLRLAARHDGGKGARHYVFLARVGEPRRDGGPAAAASRPGERPRAARGRRRQPHTS